jgi:hypothetical protein
MKTNQQTLNTFSWNSVSKEVFEVSYGVVTVWHIELQIEVLSL